jgi:hypothetical protein
MRNYCRILALAALVAAPVSGFSSENRLRSLGGERRLLTGTSAIHLYPATARDFPHFAVEVFEEWGGGIYDLGARHTIGLFLNRTSPELGTLNDRLAERGSDLFKELELNPIADVIYAAQLAAGLRAAVATTYSFDEVRRGQNLASASDWNIRIGVQAGPTDRSHLQATVGVSRQDLKDRPTGGSARRHTDGTGYSIEVRGHIPVAPHATFLPAAGLRVSAYDLEPAESEFVDLDLLLGLNISPTKKVKVVGGVGARYLSSERLDPVDPDREQTELILPMVLFGGEMQVGSLLFRVGVRHTNRSIREKLDGPATTSKNEDFESEFRADFGLGLKFGPVLLDGLIERDFLRDGPHFIGGSRRGGGVFSELSLTYYFNE